MNNNNRYLSVSVINRYLKDMFERNEHLRTVFLKGEISNYKGHSTGHLYFSLKDENSRINAIMFSSYAKKLTFVPQDGKKVLVTGRISVYEATGSYQIYVDDMQEDGVGNLYLAYEKLKADLEKEGLFDKKYKKAIPKYPETIGIVTAPTGAAIKDILSTIKRRYPICKTILFPSLVQGEYGADDIVKKIEMAQNYDLDVLIVGRGGGSIEDLWNFNEEKVARAIFASRIPIISAVGHEIDFTIADFVADMRAPTPTGAAELAVPNLTDLVAYLNQLSIRNKEAINKKINLNRLLLDSLKNSYVIKTPMIMYDNKKQKLDIDIEKLNSLILNKVDQLGQKLKYIKSNYILNNPDTLYKEKKVHLGVLLEKLDLVNPLGVLKRGYSVTKQDNKVVSSIKQVVKNKPLVVKLQDGEIETEVISIN